MRVSEIGEFGLIELLARELGLSYPPAAGAQRRDGLIVDIGDDAVISRSQAGGLIWTTDTLVAGVHFLPGRTAWRDTGWKALAVNVSDVAAMGGRPDLALVTLALPDDFLVEDALDLYRGLAAAAQRYGVSLGGGDVVRSPVFSITVALSGWAATSDRGEPLVMTRDAARLGDIVAVSGEIGDSAGGLQLLATGDAFAAAAAQRLRAAHERPEPPLDLGGRAAAAGVRCAIDVSDGLVQDLGHVVRASGVGIRVEAARLPLSAALQERLPGQAAGLALSGGEDYQLVLIGRRPAIESLLADDETRLTEIGEVVHYEPPRVAVVDENGREVPLGRAGWDHLAGG